MTEVLSEVVNLFMGSTASTVTIKVGNMSPTRKIELKHGKGNSSLTVVPFGATVISWIVDGQEKIFVSKKAVMDGTKAIRGGIPICFPNFGPWSEGRPQHGFARNSKDWKVHHEPKVDVNTGDVELVLELKDSEETRKVWVDKKFTFTYKIILKEKTLDLKVSVKNEGDEEFDLTFCFHTYFTTSDLPSVGVTDLTGLTYTDKTVEGWPQVTEENEIVKITGFTDRVYAQAPDVITFQNAENVPQIKLTKSGLKDWVVWNPYETAAKMSDMHEDAHFEFVCIEATQTSERIVLNPGQNWEAFHSMEVL